LISSIEKGSLGREDDKLSVSDICPSGFVSRRFVESKWRLARFVMLCDWGIASGCGGTFRIGGGAVVVLVVFVSLIA